MKSVIMTSGVRCDDLLKSLGIQNINVPRPRVPPRFIRPPPPLIVEKPVPTVPDVSLIIDSAATSIYSNPEVNRESPRAEGNNGRLEKSVDQSISNEGTPGMQFVNFIPTPPVVPTAVQQLTSYTQQRVDHSSPRHNFSASSEKNNQTGPGNGQDESSHNAEGGNESSFNELDVLKADVARILQVVSNQNDTILKLEARLSDINAFQEKFLVHFLRKGSGLAIGTQTETETDSSTKSGTGGDGRNSQNSLDRKSQRNSTSENPTSRSRQTQQQGQAQPEQNSNRNSPSERKNSPSSRNIPSQVPNSNSPKHSGRKISDLERRLLSGTDKHNTEDVSTILKNLQISNLQRPSLYSESSLNIDLPQFNDCFEDDNSCIGSPCIASASANGSNSEDDDDFAFPGTGEPSTTFYNNLLSTVNRLLDGNGKEINAGRSPTHESNVPRNSNSTRPAPAPPAPKSTAPPSSNRFFDDIKRNSPIADYSTSGNTVSYTSTVYSNLYDENKENAQKPNGAYPAIVTSSHQYQPPPAPITVMRENTSDNVVDSTKKYLQSLGVQFDSPVPPHGSEKEKMRSLGQPSISSTQPQQQNYMIQQNVYNSIYIPTVNCVPVVPDSIASNSGVMENLALKYIPPSELNQYEMLQGNKNAAERAGGTETTVYGMSANNLSFATKQYLQRYGLVDQLPNVQSGYDMHPTAPAPQSLPPSYHQPPPRMTAPIPQTGNNMMSDRILDITAIRNQPKLL